MPKQVRVNIRSNATSKPRKEKRNGRDVIVVSSATLPDDVVMNDIQYPADEIANSFETLARTPAPLGHPIINNKFVSARDPEGINHTWIGAWNDNVRREGGRVLLDKVIDVEVANRTDTGKSLIDAINKGEPIHTSTGLLCNLEDAPDGSDYKYIARNMVFDHDAILMNGDGAATPDDGVGMMVNSAGDDIEVVNSALDMADDQMDWAVDSLARALERRQRAPFLDQMKSVIIEAFGSTRETSAQNEGDADMADDKQLEELSAKVNRLEEGVSKIGETIGNSVAEAIKPLVEGQAELKANQEGKDKAELEGLQAKIVKANIMGEEAAKELTLNAARELAKAAEPGRAAAINGATATTGDDDYDFNEIMGLTPIKNAGDKEAVQ